MSRLPPSPASAALAGSCNGLQHYAALGLDSKGGAQVNLVPTNKPQDVYTGVCDVVKEKVGRQTLSVAALLRPWHGPQPTLDCPEGEDASLPS